jgi:hypothetical protein
MNYSYAIVTPSFKNDYERCKLLVRSIQLFAPSNVKHYIIIDNTDKKIFRSLEQSNTTLLFKEDVLPWWIKKTPFKIKGKKIWINLKGNIIRGWIIQQIIKIGIANHIPEDVLVYMDSDEFLVQKINFEEIFEKDGRVVLFRKPGETEINWDKTISKLLHLPLNNCRNIGYVEHPVVWLRQNILKLQNYLEEKNKKNWISAVSNNWHFSEYQLYGNFIEHILKDESNHFYSDNAISLKHNFLNGTPPKRLNKEELRTFFLKLNESHFSAMISSAAGIPVTDYEEFFESIVVKNIQ